MNTILIDCDGVLTDGKQYIDHTGSKMFLAFHSRDVRALRELVAHGYHVVIVTANDSESIKTFADKVGVDYCYTREKGKVPFTDFIAIGDDAWDVSMLQLAAKAYCPADADDSVKWLCGVNVLDTNGGSGVIAELARNILSDEDDPDTRRALLFKSGKIPSVEIMRKISHEKLKELQPLIDRIKAQNRLTNALRRFLIEVCKALYIDRFVQWLSKKLK